MASSSGIAGVHVVIAGQVQGVGFRFFAQARAANRGLRGYVRNLPDGRVEVLATGAREALEALVQDLRQGPPASRVKSCLVDWQEAPEPFADFTIRP